MIVAVTDDEMLAAPRARLVGGRRRISEASQGD
jgi:hypothetical protein